MVWDRVTAEYNMPPNPGDPGDPRDDNDSDENDQSSHRGRHNPPRGRHPGEGGSRGRWPEGEGSPRGGPPEDMDDDDLDKDDKDDKDRINIPADPPPAHYI